MEENIKYIQNKYGHHPAYYKYRFRGKDLPMFYMYDSYLVSQEEWESLLQPDGQKSLRNTQYDAVFIGLLVHKEHENGLMQSGFDGYYTYFASDGFTYGSNSTNWALLAGNARFNNTLFIPCVGPGYIDVRVRPWNWKNTKDREHGEYYEKHFQTALEVEPLIIAITSFNEWMEGTQIERAKPMKYHNFTYLDYQPEGPDYYVDLTKKWSIKYRRQLQIR